MRSEKCKTWIGNWKSLQFIGEYKPWKQFLSTSSVEWTVQESTKYKAGCGNDSRDSTDFLHLSLQDPSFLGPNRFILDFCFPYFLRVPSSSHGEKWTLNGREGEERLWFCIKCIWRLKKIVNVMSATFKDGFALRFECEYAHGSYNQGLISRMAFKCAEERNSSTELAGTSWI